MGDVVRDREKFAKGWIGGLPETPCGYGSRIEQTATQRRWLPAIAARYGIRTIADIGAGDLNWMRRIEWPAGVTYSAYDLVPRHPSVTEFDLVRQVPPCVDMILCLWVLNHLPFDDCRAALANIRSSKSRYLCMTDRPKWRSEQPPELALPAIDAITVRPETGDRIIVVDLWAC